MHPIKNILPTLLTFLCCFLFSFPSFLPSFLPSAHAKAGELDVSFGENGLVKLKSPGADLNPSAYVSSLAIQLDGKIILGWNSVVGGYIDSHGNFHLNEMFFALQRYNTDGSLDTSFGEGGKIIKADIPGRDPQGYYPVFGKIAIQQDGKIIVGGKDRSSSGNSSLVIWRYHPNGTPDVSFGTSGQVLTNFISDGFSSALLQPDGKILFGADVAGFTPSGGDFLLLRYDSNGLPDPNFEANGVVVTNFGSSSHDTPTVMALQSDGKILAGGFSDTDFVLARYNPDGTLDRSFGDNNSGFTKGDLGLFEGWDLREQSDGKILAVGRVTEFVDPNNPTVFKNKLILVRYLPNGRLDSSFGMAGKVTLSLYNNDNLLRDALFQRDGKIVAFESPSSIGEYNFVLSRYHADGSLDDGIGMGGRIVNQFEGMDQGTSGEFIESQLDGRILAAWYYPSDSTLNFTGGSALARFLGDTTTGPTLSGNIAGKGGCTCDLRRNPDRSDYFSWLLMVLGGVGVLFWRWRCVKGGLR